MYLKQTLCKSRPSRGGVWGYAPQKIFEKNTCPETESGGSWRLADSPTPCVQNYSINTKSCKCILEQGFKVIMTS